jgi:hypothetical protein
MRRLISTNPDAKRGRFGGAGFGLMELSETAQPESTQ